MGHLFMCGDESGSSEQGLVQYLGRVRKTSMFSAEIALKPYFKGSCGGVNVDIQATSPWCFSASSQNHGSVFSSSVWWLAHARDSAPGNFFTYTHCGRYVGKTHRPRELFFANSVSFTHCPQHFRVQLENYDQIFLGQNLKVRRSEPPMNRYNRMIADSIFTSQKFIQK